MKVILLGELRGKGGEGDVVDVAQGYAENFLFPNRMALAATPGNIKQLEERRHNIAKREEKRIATAEQTKNALEGKNVQIAVKVGEEGQLFGSVTNAMIADAVKEQLDIEIDRKRIEHHTIKVAGVHEVVINLYREISAKLQLIVGSASAQAAEKTDEVVESVEADDAAAETAADEVIESVEADDTASEASDE